MFGGAIARQLAVALSLYCHFPKYFKLANALVNLDVDRDSFSVNSNVIVVFLDRVQELQKS